ncbi:MAG: N-acetyltransferase [Deltaproteobacteria bacterium]|nr:N-acetyltransferase [Deltaproteobacteria bacterium]MBW2415539.1 N-acetyltransferase [Deltaproteobacteria bacterium]
MSAGEEGIFVRLEEPEDVARVFEINVAAFGRRDEAELTDRLRAEVSPLIAHVATRGSESGPVIGCSMWSPVEIRGEIRGEEHSPQGYTSSAFALGPIAVWPEEQKKGIGGLLMRAGFDACREAGELLLFLLGHPTYYPRFGFRPAWEHGLWYGGMRGPNPAFMYKELAEGALADRKGEVVYSLPFRDV